MQSEPRPGGAGDSFLIAIPSPTTTTIPARKIRPVIPRGSCRFHGFKPPPRSPPRSIAICRYRRVGRARLYSFEKPLPEPARPAYQAGPPMRRSRRDHVIPHGAPDASAFLAGLRGLAAAGRSAAARHCSPSAPFEQNIVIKEEKSYGGGDGDRTRGVQLGNYGSSSWAHRK
jgi:hypothetical protein